MGEKKYLLADVSKKLDVPSYMLRYYEDSLSISIPKDERGLRYYTKHEVELLSSAIMLNRKGFTIPALRIIMNDIHRIKKLPPDRLLELRDRLEACTGRAEENSIAERTEKNELSTNEPDNEKMERFKSIMTGIMLDALKINNEELVNHINYGVGNMVEREIGYMMTKKEEADEERFKKVDRMLREISSK